MNLEEEKETIEQISRKRYISHVVSMYNINVINIDRKLKEALFEFGDIKDEVFFSMPDKINISLKMKVIESSDLFLI